MLAPVLLLALQAAPTDIILITIDTLRADRVGAYGSKAGATKTMDGLAARGVVVEEAVVQAPQTRPSHASLFTGLLPFEHGLRDNASPPLGKAVPTLATTLRAAGYATAAFIAAYPVSRASGLDSGFEVFDDPFGGGADFLAGAGDRNERPGREVIDAALAWLARPTRKPRFVWVHLFEPHYPYEPRPPFDGRFPGAPYDGEVATADAELKRLFDRFPPSPSRLVVVTSDHGEGLGDHGEDEHHLFVYDSTLKVPLILAGSDLRAGLRVRGQFRSIDLMPTMLTLVGVASPRVSGVSRAQNLRTGALIPDNESYAESLYGSIHFGYAPVRALRAEGFKYIDTPRPELYRVATDPAETSNLVEARGPLSGAMQRRLREMHGEGAGRAAAATVVDPVALERLAALGYVGGSAPQPGAPAPNLPDPKDRVDHYNRYSRAVNAAISARRRDDALGVIAALQPIAREFGSHFSVTSFLGQAYLDLRRFTEALPHLTRARDISPTAGPVWGRLAEALGGAGRPADALDAVEKGLAVSPRSANLIRLKVALLSRAGREADAAAFLDRAVKANPGDGLLMAELANLHRNEGDLASAEATSARAIRLSPRAADAWVSRALALAALDRVSEAATAFAKAQELDPSNADAWFYGGALALRRGEASAALNQLARAEALDPDRPGLRQATAAARSLRVSSPSPPSTGAVRLRIIRVRTRATAEEAQWRLAGGEDFEKVARSLSVDPSAARGGELGWVIPNELRPEIAEVARKLADGERGGIVPTSGGFVILKRESGPSGVR